MSCDVKNNFSALGSPWSRVRQPKQLDGRYNCGANKHIGRSDDERDCSHDPYFPVDSASGSSLSWDAIACLWASDFEPNPSNLDASTHLNSVSSKYLEFSPKTVPVYDNSLCKNLQVQKTASEVGNRRPDGSFAADWRQLLH